VPGLIGIGLLTGVGAVAVRGDDRARRHPLVGLAYGAGLALIVDEFALLLDLKDVYWARQGRISVDLGIPCRTERNRHTGRDGERAAASSRSAFDCSSKGSG
jgi:hypothetical protein